MPRAYCLVHKVSLQTPDLFNSSRLVCPYDRAVFSLGIAYDDYQTYILDMINRDALKDLKIVRIDAEGATVLAKESIRKDPSYFIESKLTDTRKGLELMILVGKKDESGQKVQLFVDLPAQRLSFDHNAKDIHPSGLFSEIKATFKDSYTEITENFLLHQSLEASYDTI